MITKIDSLALPELELYTRLTEAELKHIYEPDPGVFIAESPLVIGRALDAGCTPLSILMEQHKNGIPAAEQAILDRCHNIPVYAAPTEVLYQLKGFALVRGMLCAMRRPKLPALEKICANSKRIVILENVVNPTNVGAIFRSAAALGIDGILLTPGCSDPLYRRAVRVSMGTVFLMSWTYFDMERDMALLHDYGYKTAAMILSDDSVPISNPDLAKEERLAIILGTEGDGLSNHTILQSDYHVKIPMSPGVDSLNVAAASAVAFWELGKHSTQ